MTDSSGGLIIRGADNKVRIKPVGVSSHGNKQKQHGDYEPPAPNSTSAMANCPLPHQQSQSESERIIREIGPYDVLTGRSSECFNNIGNRRFRVTISLNLKEYMEATTRDDKSWVIASVVRKMREEIGYRFLKKVTVAGKPAVAKQAKATTTTKKKFIRKKKGMDVPTEISYYYLEVGERKMREKVGHALRDLSVQLQSPPIPSTPTTTTSTSSKNGASTSCGKKRKPCSEPSQGVPPSSLDGLTTQTLPFPPHYELTSGRLSSKRQVSSSPLPVPELKDADEEDGDVGDGEDALDRGDRNDSDNECLNDIWSKWDKDAPRLDMDPIFPPVYDVADDSGF